ncbi:hypothetical protein BN7_3952 [Wickerhamomyces ciferrii]|uniref:Uncharacterized protein n=1 Tax=Wickerhamomyces ciferrii (strain ATCC 14091 / BCRC 22168 / CBS 111 / JCM 3599 / NBRC 0793 / NRRL Y-1031 F-60-10) TaxID=1206466 RepID=K0KSQ3_WICCF|nr:uncharacterized protein BN7_3952 [Wickerhamomyces ciferrii]CCH44389.1 hypothetical protein BN7_3952 [Wickerhamomyces ciferrii]
MADNNDLSNDIVAENNNTMEYEDIEDVIKGLLAFDSLPYAGSIFKIVPYFHMCPHSKRLIPKDDHFNKILREKPYFTDMPIPLHPVLKSSIKSPLDLNNKSFKRFSSKIPIKTFDFTFEDVIGFNGQEKWKPNFIYKCSYIRGLHKFKEKLSTSKLDEKKLNDCLINNFQHILNDLINEEKEFIIKKLENGEEYNGTDIQYDCSKPVFPNGIHDFLFGPDYMFAVHLSPSRIPPKQVLKTFLTVLHSGIKIEERNGFIAEYRNDEYSVLMIADETSIESEILRVCDSTFRSYIKLNVNQGYPVKQERQSWLIPSIKNYKLIDAKPPLYSEP